MVFVKITKRGEMILIKMNSGYFAVKNKVRQTTKLSLLG